MIEYRTAVPVLDLPLVEAFRLDRSGPKPAIAGGSLPIELEPYRIIIALVFACWFCALAADPVTDDRSVLRIGHQHVRSCRQCAHIELRGAIAVAIKDNAALHIVNAHTVDPGAFDPLLASALLLFLANREPGLAGDHRDADEHQHQAAGAHDPQLVAAYEGEGAEHALVASSARDVVADPLGPLVGTHRPDGDQLLRAAPAAEPQLPGLAEQRHRQLARVQASALGLAGLGLAEGRLPAQRQHVVPRFPARRHGDGRQFGARYGGGAEDCEREGQYEVRLQRQFQVVRRLDAGVIVGIGRGCGGRRSRTRGICRRARTRTRPGPRWRPGSECRSRIRASPLPPRQRVFHPLHHLIDGEAGRLAGGHLLHAPGGVRHRPRRDAPEKSSRRAGAS